MKEKQSNNCKFMNVLNEIAEKYAKKYNYELKTKEVYDKTQDYHPLNITYNEPLISVKYEASGDDDSYIQTRQRFGSPRIGIYAPNREWFVALEYKDCIISECQIFNEKGFDMVSIIKKEIEELWQKKNQ